MRALLSEASNWGQLRRTPYGFGPALVLGLLSLFGAAGAEVFAIAGPFVIRDLEIDYRDVINATALVGFFLIFASLGVAYYADRHKRVPLVGIGALAGAVFTAISSFATSITSLMLPRLGDQVSDHVSGTPRFSLLADYYPAAERGKVFSFLGTMRNVAALLSPVIGGVLIDAVGWRTAVRVFVPPLAIVAIYALVKLREPKRGYMERKALGATEEEANEEDEPISFGEGWRTLWATRTLRRSFIGDAIVSVGLRLYSVIFPLFLFEEYGFSATALGAIGTFNAALAVAGTYLGGGLIDTFTKRRPGRVLLVVGAFQVIAALGISGIATAPPVVLLALFFGLLGFGFALVGPSLSVIYAQVTPPNIRTLGTSLNNLALVPAYVIGLPIAGALVSNYSLQAGLVFAVPFIVVGSLVFASAAGMFELDMRSASAASLASREWRHARRSGAAKLLVLRDVDVHYNSVQVLFGVDLDVEEGEIVALLGTNGAGKSTLLRAISGTQEASSGAIVFAGRDITHMPPHEIAARGVVQMPGGKGVFPELTVRDNLLLGGWLDDDPARTKQRLREVFELFPSLRDRADTVAGALSGGEQQMVALGQAMLQNPKLLMIDELSLGLSPAMVGQLIDAVREIAKTGVTVIVVEQSVNVALTLAERAVFMEKGEVRFVGPTADLLARPDILRSVYVKGAAALTDTVPSAARSDAGTRAMSLAEARPVLEIENVTKRFGGVVAVDDVSLTLREGEVLGLIGPNGSGKTTLLELVSGYQTPDAGRIVLDGVDVTLERPEVRAGRGLVRRFQDARGFPSLTVFETVLVALEQRLEVRSWMLSAVAAPAARRAERRLRARAERLIDLLELDAFRDKFVSELSTGVRRIVDLACVLAAEPKVLLLDEPSSGIAQAEAEALAPLLKRVRFETGCSILIIEHDIPLISAVSDELVALRLGAVIARGRPDEVLENEEVISSYLGSSVEAINRSGSLI